MTMKWDEILGYGTAGGLAAGPIGIAAGVGTGLLGSILSSKAQSSANKYNLQAVRETNAANQAINEANLAASREAQQLNFEEAARGRAFESQQAELARRFNAREAKLARDFQSPREQARLKLAAGLNPLADVGGSSAAMASGSPLPSAPIGGSGSVPSSIPMQAGLVSPVSNQLALVGQILKDVSVSRAQLRTTERGQDIQKAIEEEKSRIEASKVRVQNELGQMAQAENERMGASQRALNETLINTGNLEAKKMELDLQYLPQIMESKLNLDAAQAYSYYGAVRNQAAQVKAMLAQIATEYRMHSESLANHKEEYKRDLETHIHDFAELVTYQGRENLHLKEREIEQAKEIWKSEFERGEEGLQPALRSIGVHDLGGLVLGAGSLGVGYGMLKNSSRRSTKKIQRDYYSGGYKQYETYYP